MYTDFPPLWNRYKSKVGPLRPATLPGSRSMNEDKPAAREERLKAALRANLRRRKAQERGRAAPDKPTTERDDASRERS
ncbi:hypothetical protein [Methylobacterium sp. SD21]|uniref:hypothetical protein n=1 Tax=Methylobacterium litchii TaxID=3138810 RepID=UPI00313AE317